MGTTHSPHNFKQEDLSTFYWPPAESNVRGFNKHAVLDLIRFPATGLSRTEIADKMGLTWPAISLIANGLLESGVVLEIVQPLEVDQ